MPIKHIFILKTVVRGSDNIETPSSILKELKALRSAVESNDSPQVGEFEILASKKEGVISDDLYTEGKLTEDQNNAAKSILKQAIDAVTNAPEDGKLKIKFEVNKA